MAGWNKGKTTPQHVKIKQSLSRRKNWENAEYRANMIAKHKALVTPQYIEIMRRRGLKGAKTLYKRQPTSLEIKLYNKLSSKSIIFEKQRLINNRFLVDAYIPSQNLIIEVDGDYWHNLDRVRKKDKAENAYLTKCGYKLLRLTESELDGNFINII